MGLSLGTEFGYRSLVACCKVFRLHCDTSAEGEMAGAEDILYAFLLSSISNLQFTIVFVISCLS